MPELDKQKLWELDAAYQEVLDDLAMEERVVNAVEAALGRIAREHYPALGNWNAKQLRQLAETISRHASDFCTEISDLDYWGHKKE